MAKVWKLNHSLWLRYPNLLCPMTPLVCLEYEMTCIPRATQNLTRWTFQWYWTQWTLGSIRAEMTLHTTTQNLADGPTLANGSPYITRADMTCIPLHKTWQMNLLWLNTMAKVWKLQQSLFLRFPTADFSNTFLLRKRLSFVPRAPEIITSKFQGYWTQWWAIKQRWLWILLNQTWQALTFFVQWPPWYQS